MNITTPQSSRHNKFREPQQQVATTWRGRCRPPSGLQVLLKPPVSSRMPAAELWTLSFIGEKKDHRWRNDRETLCISYVRLCVWDWGATVSFWNTRESTFQNRYVHLPQRRVYWLLWLLGASPRRLRMERAACPAFHGNLAGEQTILLILATLRFIGTIGNGTAQP